MGIDLLRDCMASMGVAQEEQSVADFVKVFCRLCWNKSCPRAEQTDLPWEQRMSTQVERLLTNPNIAPLGDPRFDNIRRIPFKDLFMDAMRIEIANQRGDWQVPVLPGDPGTELETLAPPQHTDHVDTAVKALAQALGKEKPELPEKPEPSEPTEPEPEAENVVPVPNHFRRKNQAQQANTDFPLEGVMIGGDPVPETKPEAQTPVDPWAVPEAPKGEKIAVGGTIQLGSPTEDKVKK